MPEATWALVPMLICMLWGSLPRREARGHASVFCCIPLTAQILPVGVEAAVWISVTSELDRDKRDKQGNVWHSRTHSWYDKRCAAGCSGVCVLCSLIACFYSISCAAAA